MGKYSSDSDYEKRGSKSSYKSRSRRRSASSESSSSRSRRTGRSDRSRGRSDDKHYRSKRSSSRSHKSRSYHSRDKVRHQRSSSRDHRRTTKTRSRDRYRKRRSRSRSKSYIREYVSKPKRHSSTSSSGSNNSTDSASHSDRSRSKLSSKDKRQPASNGKVNSNNASLEIESSPEVTIIDTNVLDDINSDGFTQKKFTSSKTKKVPENIVIDLKKQTIKVPEVEPVEPDSIFHHNLFLNEEARTEKWVKELYSYRQKALQQGIKNNH